MHSLDAYDMANRVERDLLLTRLARTHRLHAATAREESEQAPFPPRRRAWWGVRPRPAAG